MRDHIGGGGGGGRRRGGGGEGIGRDKNGKKGCDVFCISSDQ